MSQHQERREEWPAVLWVARDEDGIAEINWGDEGPPPGEVREYVPLEQGGGSGLGEGSDSFRFLADHRARVISHHYTWLEREIASREMWIAGLHRDTQPARCQFESEKRILEEALSSLQTPLPNQGGSEDRYRAALTEIAYYAAGWSGTNPNVLRRIARDALASTQPDPSGPCEREA